MQIKFKMIIFLICLGLFAQAALEVKAVTNTADAVADAYEVLLGREPDQAGFDWWVNAIDSGAFTFEQMVAGMSYDAAVTNAATETASLAQNAAAQEVYDIYYDSGASTQGETKTVEEKLIDTLGYAYYNNLTVSDVVITDSGFSIGCSNGGVTCGGGACAAADTGPEPEVCDTCDCPGYPACYVPPVCDTCDCPGYPACYVPPSCDPSCGSCSVSCGGGRQTCTDSDCNSYTQSCNTQSCDNGCAATTPIGQTCWNGYAWVEGVYNSAPQVSNLTAPNWNYTQAAGTVLRANPQFNFIDTDPGSFGSAYQVIVKKGDDTPVLDTGKCTGYLTPSADCKINGAVCLKNGVTGCLKAGDCVCQYPLDSGKLNYNTSYKWWVKVWDNNNTGSALTQYSAAADTDNNDGSALTFTTYKHRMPIPGAAYLSAKLSRGEPVKFTSTAKTFLTAAPEAEVACAPALCSYFWTVPAGATIDDPASSTPTIVFNGSGLKSVTLKVTDLIDGYYASAIIPVEVKADLPAWREVRPE